MLILTIRLGDAFLSADFYGCFGWLVLDDFCHLFEFGSVNDVANMCINTLACLFSALNV